MHSFTVFKSKDYTKLFLASFASRMASVIGMTALVFYLLKRFSSQPFYATLNEMMYSLPTVFVFFIVGVAADRLDRQKIVVTSDWIRAGLSLGLILTLVMNWIPGIFILLFLRESVSKFFSPAESAIIQGILTKDQYAVAAFLPSPEMSNKTGIIWLPGLPNSPTAPEMGKPLSDLGFTVLQARYPGNWQSYGNFDPSSSVAGALTGIDLLAKGSTLDLTTEKRVFWDVNHIVLIGNSYGGGIARH